jgi:hypothetical protein
MSEEVDGVHQSNFPLLEIFHHQGEGADVVDMIIACLWVEENLEKLPNFWKQQNMALVDRHEQQFFGNYALVEFLHFIPLLNAKFCGAQTT